MATTTDLKRRAAAVTDPSIAEAQRLADIAAGAQKLKTHARTTAGKFRPTARKRALQPDGPTPPPAEEAGPGAPDDLA